MFRGFLSPLGLKCLFTLTLLSTAAVSLLSETAEQVSESQALLDSRWGLFKPHLLACLTQRSLNPLNFGLLYSSLPSNFNVRSHLRWEFETTGSGMKARYLTNNGRDIAEHLIEDFHHNLLLNTKHITPIQPSAAVDNEWTFQMNASRLENEPSPSPFHIYLYLSLTTYVDDSDKRNSIKSISLDRNHIEVILQDNRKLQFLLQLGDSEDAKQIQVIAVSINASNSWDINEILKNNINFDGSLTNPLLESSSNDDELMEISDIQANIFILRVSSKLLLNASSPPLSILVRLTHVDIPPIEEQHAVSFSEEFESRKRLFDTKVSEVFGNSLPFTTSVISDLLGGLVFYHGRVAVKNSAVALQPSRTVFSASPSRRVFPRAFLWDEGFHDQIICQWDRNLCLEILEAWMNLQDVLGYFPREQVRTPEISRRVPHGFRSQDAHEANPPTLLLPILQLIEEQSSSTNIQTFIQKNLSKLEKWFKWLVKSQQHNEGEGNSFGTFRWRCKNNHCKEGNYLGSGLDDYPRESQTTKSFQHIDLHCWMAFFSQSLSRLSLETGRHKQAKEYSDITEQLVDQLYEDFLDTKDGLFYDQVVERKDNDGSKNSPSSSRHIGYITLFPLLINVVTSDSKEFSRILDVLSDPSHLWSNYGIRSLSLSDEFFGKDDNYWRGPIWMPFNYLILRTLKKHYSHSARATEIYHSLRSNLIKNVQSNWETSSDGGGGGYLYETYHPITGKGQRGFPFNGWTALILLIMNEKY